MAAVLRIPARFNGPPRSANGGYTCGLVAEALGLRSAEVSLRAPPPLDRALDLRRRDGSRAELRDGETVVAEARAVEVSVANPEPITPQRAEEAVRAGVSRWSDGHPFPTCFACGPDRVEGDGLLIFPAELGDGRFAATWTPHPSLGDERGAVRDAYVWAALDCPTSAPVANWGEGRPVVLARLAASVEAPVRAGEPHTLVSWELGRDGRKREAACVLADAGGRVLARSRALWIELRE